MSLSKTQREAIVELHDAIREYEYERYEVGALQASTCARLDDASGSVSSELGVTLEAVNDVCGGLLGSQKYLAELDLDSDEAIDMLVERLERIARS